MRKFYFVVIILMAALVGATSYVSNIAFNKVAGIPLQLLVLNSDGSNKNGLSYSSIIDSIAESYNNNTATVTTASGESGASGASQPAATTNTQKAAEVLKENGLNNIANAVENNDKAKLNSEVQNLTDEEFKQVIQVLGSSGHKSEADVIQAMGKDQAIKLYNQSIKNK